MEYGSGINGNDTMVDDHSVPCGFALAQVRAGEEVELLEELALLPFDVADFGVDEDEEGEAVHVGFNSPPQPDGVEEEKDAPPARGPPLLGSHDDMGQINEINDAHDKEEEMARQVNAPPPLGRLGRLVVAQWGRP